MDGRINVRWPTLSSPHGLITGAKGSPRKTLQVLTDAREAILIAGSFRGALPEK